MPSFSNEKIRLLALSPLTEGKLGILNENGRERFL